MRDEPGAPKVVDRSAFQAELDALRVREKDHTIEGDDIAAARRRLPMVEVDGATSENVYENKQWRSREVKKSRSCEARSRGPARRCLRVVTLRLSTLDSQLLDSNSTEQSENAYEKKGQEQNVW